MGSVSYEETQVSARGKKGTPVSVPVQGFKQRYALPDYRGRFAHIQLKSPKTVPVLSPSGTTWKMDNRSAFDASREPICQLVNTPGFIVIEDVHIWDRISAFMKVNDSDRFHDNRNERTALAHPWHNIIEVVDHAVMMSCHPDSWARAIPRNRYATGETVVFQEDLTITTFGAHAVEPEQALTDLMCNLNAL